MLNDYDTLGNVNDCLELGKGILFMVSPVTDFGERSKPDWVATPTINHGAKISFVS